MPSFPQKTALKALSGRTVPAQRFNLNPGAPSRVLHSDHARSTVHVLRPDLNIVPHPILWSIPAARSAEEQESLPVQRPGAAGPLFPDRREPEVRWYLPSFEERIPSETDATLIVRDVGVNREGEAVYSGVVTFRFEKHTPEAVSQALASERQTRPEVDGREIPVAVKEVILTLNYTEDGEEHDLVFTAPYDTERHEARFELRASALKLAFAMLAKRKGVDLTIVGDYNAWVSPPDGPAVPQTFSQSGGWSAIQPTLHATMHVLKRDPSSKHSSLPVRGSIRTVSPLLAASRLALRTTPEAEDTPEGSAGEAFAFVVEDVFSIEGRGTVVAGTALHGRASVGDRVTLHSPNAKSRSSIITRIRRKQPQRRMRKSIKTLAETGPAVLTLRGLRKDMVAPGDRIIRTAAPSGTDTPEASDDAPVFIRQRQIFEQTLRLHLPCSRFPHAYRTAHAEGDRSIGCTPPWSDGFRGGARYRLLDGDDVALPTNLRNRVTVYESLNEVAAFLLVPRSYVITRTIDTFAPTVSMTSVLDPENNAESKVVFDVVVAPDLLPFDLERIRAALVPYLTQTMGDRRSPPTLQFPTALPTPPDLSWHDPFTAPSGPTADGDAYALSVEAHSIGEAVAVVARLRDRRQGLNGRLQFSLDDTQSTSSSLHISLGRTSGPALTQDRRPDQHAVVLRNGTESPVDLHRLLIGTDTPDTPEIRSLEDTELPPDGVHTVSLPSSSPTALVLPDYKVREDTSRSLSELRVDVSILEVLLAVDTDLQPDASFSVAGRSARVSHLHVSLRLGNERSVTLQAANDHRFNSEVVSFFVPLDRYLHPEHRRIEYRATFRLKDASGAEDERTTDWYEHNYGSSTNLTVRRHLLEDLL